MSKVLLAKNFGSQLFVSTPHEALKFQLNLYYTYDLIIRNEELLGFTELNSEDIANFSELINKTETSHYCLYCALLPAFCFTHDLVLITASPAEELLVGI